MDHTDDHGRKKAILDAAWAAFSTYGFRKTSMDDIARGAGISRPTLYLYFRSKEDIFRSLVAAYYDEMVADVRSAFGTAQTPRAALAAAFGVQSGGITAATLSSAHGGEIWDTGFATSSDIVADGEARLLAAYRDWLEAEARAGRIGLTAPAADTAETLTSTVRGLKKAVGSAEAYQARLAALAEILGAGLEAQAGRKR